MAKPNLMPFLMGRSEEKGESRREKAKEAKNPPMELKEKAHMGKKKGGKGGGGCK